MKNSISKKIIGLLCCNMLVFVGIMYAFIHDGVQWAFETYYENAASLATKLVIATMHDPAGNKIRTLQQMCDENQFAYAYMYEIISEKKIKYLTFVKNSLLDNEESEKISVGVEKEVSLKEEDLQVWHGERSFATYENDNKYGHVYTCLQGVYDDTGKCVAIAGVDVLAPEVDNKYFEILRESLLCVFGIFLLMIAVTILLLRKHLFVPIGKLKLQMEAFVQKDYVNFEELPVKGNHELSAITKAFNKVKLDIKQYMETVCKLNKERDTQQAEKNIAAAIQKDMLPKETFADGSIEIRAFLQPAKTIGGDFYDYVNLKNGKWALVIADVSGKGISAALFMARTIAILNENFKSISDPAKILASINNSLCAKNKSFLFVTMFLAVYDEKNHALTYANAGHDHPYLLRDNGCAALENSEGSVLGFFEDEEYVNATIPIQAGDLLYFYTDGVTEAVNCQNQFFGGERLEAVLAKTQKSSANALVETVLAELDKFCEGACHQHDDITMMAVSFKKCIALELDPTLDSLKKIKKIIIGNGNIPEKKQKGIYLAMEEIFVNIVSYGYEGKEEKGSIVFMLELYDDDVSLTFIDDGNPYNPLEKVDIPREEEDLMVGGLGKFIAFSVMPHAEYRYENGKNILTMSAKKY